MGRKPASGNDDKGKPKFWANDFLRQLAASNAAQEMGPNACWLLTIVAMQQDAPAIRYSRPARFWNSQLQSEMGLGEKAVKEARDQAIAAGWLKYTKGNRKLAGQYEVKFPAGYQPVYAQPFTVENDGQTDGQLPASQPFTVDNDGQTDGQTGTLTVENDGQTDGLSTRTRKPVPVHTPRIASARDGFQEFWNRVHRKEGKGAAKKAYARAVAIVQQEHDWDAPRSMQFINDRMTQFAASPQARDDVKGKIHPSTWLNQARYDDDDAIWVQGQDEAATREAAYQASNADARRRFDLARRQRAARKAI